MCNRFTCYLLLIFIFLAANMTIQTFYRNIKTVTPVEVVHHNDYWLKVVLLPLDSRPPCTQYLEMLGEISGIQVIMPPTELLDNYKIPANKDRLREWLLVESANADAAIISVDMLTHGSLLASRFSSGSVADSQVVVELLKTIHANNKNLKIYAFNIIPRLLLADSKENSIYQKNVFKYSVLKEQLYTFENPLDMEKLEKLQDQIPEPVLIRYNELYQRNVIVNLALANLVQEGIISTLVIGQDDGHIFGIPNIIKQQIQNHTNLLAKRDNIIITRGTDEVALTLLGKIITDFSHYQPRVFVMYSDADAPRVTMPYMPNTVATTVNEKISLVGAIETFSINNADFVLFVHIGTENNTHRLPEMADQLKSLIEQGHKVALVDLSENYYGSQTLFPWLAKRNVAATNLIAYAGWNTTSNSIGTAITEAVAFTDGLHRYQGDSEVLRLYQNNLEFLTARFLDDWYFQKNVQVRLNTYLKDRQVDSYNLEDNYNKTNRLTNTIMQSRAQALYRNYFDNHAISVTTSSGNKQLYITRIQLVSYLPWARTFEIYVKPSLSYGLYPGK
ncbi:hypothetical protein SDC9_05918 [bioreactor metagenome]|uniref:DUF4127 family protein n=1 Tax=bioreactor metagenome TaxID=1076179 RepID=A0A644T1K2_9ZZZZ